MKTLLNKWFVTGCLIWLTVYTARKFSHPLPFINGYIDDAFAVPVIASFGLWFKRIFIIRNDHYVLSGGQVLFIVMYVSVVFEVLLPYYSKTYTADWVDVVLYAAGGWLFYKIMNKPVLVEK